MKTEREAFDLWFKKNFHDLHEAICCGDLVAKNYKKAMFKSWCASASREGYKLVPLELVDEIEDKIWDNLSANHTITNQEGDGFIPVEDIDLGGIYKAMIGVNEKRLHDNSNINPHDCMFDFYDSCIGWGV